MIQDAGKLCDLLTPASGQSCGKEGYYTVNHKEASLALTGAACAAKRRVNAGATDDEAYSSFVEMKDVALV